MQLVEQHIVTKTSKFYKECDDLCFRSKNLYNSCLYFIRNFEGDGDDAVHQLYHSIKTADSYEKLPPKVAQGTIILVKQNIKAFKAALKAYKICPKKFKGEPEFPHFLHKIRGRFLTTFNNQAFSKKVFLKAHKIKLSQCNIEFTTKIEKYEDIDCIRIVPNVNYFTIDVVYTVNHKEKMTDNKRYAGIDPGVSNLAAICTNDIDVKPIIINGRPLKSMIQYYNKKKAKIQSTLEKRNNKKWSNKLNILNLKKKNKVDDYLHKASKKVVEHCVENKINTVIIGKNEG